MDWRHIAACREVDPELFFPIGNSGPALLQIEEAKQVCHRCTVMDECLRWAIDSGQDAGARSSAARCACAPAPPSEQLRSNIRVQRQAQLCVHSGPALSPA